MDDIFLSKNFSNDKRIAMIDRIKSMLNSDEGITLYLKGLQFYKNMLFVKNIIDLMYNKIIINSDGSINITTITSTDVYLLNQILNLNIPKYLKREVIDLLSTIIEVTI
ncbi:hypothetical protein [Clostridium butyricum]|uniref:hypothetical protein n=1 Tax=Clostridium butyricum TaxID=1492 RepID=UPI00374F9051